MLIILLPITSSQGFDEQAIHFPPTFKFRPHSDEYNFKRVPSWTDRILHTVNATSAAVTLTPLYYRCGGSTVFVQQCSCFAVLHCTGAT